jgi:hypothetical protein
MRLVQMLTAVILICSFAVTPDIGDCTRDNAITLMRVPGEFGNPIACLMRGETYLAHTAIGQELGADDRVKLVCAQRQVTERIPVGR